MWRGPFIVGVIVFALPPRETMQRYGVDIKFIRSNHPQVDALVSYADPSAGHSGTIYRAANWESDGHTDGTYIHEYGGPIKS